MIVNENVCYETVVSYYETFISIHYTGMVKDVVQRFRRKGLDEKMDTFKKEKRAFKKDMHKTTR